MQKDYEILEKEPLLNDSGHLNKEGWARSLILDYNRKAIKAGSLRIKEWDYYLITCPDYAIALTIDDNSYMGLDSISLLDFRGKAFENPYEGDEDRRKGDRRSGIDRRTGEVNNEGDERRSGIGRRKGDRRKASDGFDGIPFEQTTSPMSVMTLGMRAFPASSVRGDVESEGKEYSMRFENPGPDREGKTVRKLSFKMAKFADAEKFGLGSGTVGIEGEIRLTQYPGDTIVMATPFSGKKTAFYYNQKINCQEAEGWAKIVSADGKELSRYEFSPEDSFGCLDWGRGVWTYKNTWYWGSASGLVDGKRFGFNIGYGFGDNPATENMVFYDGVGHKLENVSFNIPSRNKTFTTRGGCCGTEAGMTVETADSEEAFMEKWTFTSDDDRFEMDFTPILDRAANTDLKIVGSNQHQVFGHFTGRVTLDDGTVLHIKDMLGFAEKVSNKW